MKLDSISDRTAYSVAAGGLLASVVAAVLAPQDVQLGAWVRLAIWHGMLKWAAIIVIFTMGALAAGYLITRRRALHEWSQAMQIAALPVWAFAVAVGAAAAKIMWGSFNWTEQRMVMSLAYTIVAAVALLVGLSFDRPGLTAAMIIVSSIAMAVGLAWVRFMPSVDTIHPAAAVMGSEDPMFQVFAYVMLAGNLAWVAALAVPIRRWLSRHAEAAPE